MTWKWYADEVASILFSRCTPEHHFAFPSPPYFESNFPPVLLTTELPWGGLKSTSVAWLHDSLLSVEVEMSPDLSLNLFFTDFQNSASFWQFLLANDWSFVYCQPFDANALLWVVLVANVDRCCIRGFYHLVCSKKLFGSFCIVRFFDPIGSFRTTLVVKTSFGPDFVLIPSGLIVVFTVFFFP